MSDDLRDDDKREERDALCPDCGQAFRAWVDRLMPESHWQTPHPPVECPHCGCKDCALK